MVVRLLTGEEVTLTTRLGPVVRDVVLPLLPTSVTIARAKRPRTSFLIEIIWLLTRESFFPYLDVRV